MAPCSQQYSLSSSHCVKVQDSGEISWVKVFVKCKKHVLVSNMKCDFVENLFHIFYFFFEIFGKTLNFEDFSLEC